MTAAIPRLCVKLFARESGGVADASFVPIFHEWIRNRSIEGVLLDVADYTHVPEGPGVMLVAHAAILSLDRSEGHLGLVAQRRRPSDGPSPDLLAFVMAAADGLEREPTLAGKLAFDRSWIRIEANDRLRFPNTDAGFRRLAPIVQAAVERAMPGTSVVMTRVDTDPRDRLSVDARMQ